MPKKSEISLQVKSLVQLVSSKNFFSDFQKKNYNLLIKHYQELAENLANDYDNWKIKYDNLADNSPNKLAYKGKMEQAEKNLQPHQEALNKIETEINHMQDLLNLLTKIDQDNQTIKATLESLKPTSGGNATIDLSNLATKQDWKAISDKITPPDFTALSEQVKGVDAKLDNLKFPTVDLTATDSKLNSLQTSLNEIISKPGVDLTPLTSQIGNLQTSVNNLKPVDLSSTNAKIEAVSESLSTLTKGQEALRNKKVAELFIKNAQPLKDYENQNPSTFITDSNQFIKACKNDTGTQDFKAHVIMRQDAITKLWGVLYKWRGNNSFWWASPNITNREQERQQAEQWIKSQGINQSVGITDFKGANSDGDLTYSFLFSLSCCKLMASYWGNSKRLTFDEMKDESTWKPQIEAELKQYEADTPLTLNCPCDIRGLTNQLSSMQLGIAKINETPRQRQQRIFKAYIDNNQFIKDIEAANRTEGYQQPRITFNQEAFLKGVRENADKAKLDDKRSRLLPWLDEKTGLWGVVWGTWHGTTGASEINYLCSFSTPTYDLIRGNVTNWQKAQGINGGQNVGLGNWEMNPNNDPDYSFKWSLGMIYILTQAWKDKNQKPNWGDIRDESKWKPQIEAEINKYDDTQWMAQIEIKE